MVNMEEQSGILLTDDHFLLYLLSMSLMSKVLMQCPKSFILLNGNCLWLLVSNFLFSVLAPRYSFMYLCFKLYLLYWGSKENSRWVHGDLSRGLMPFTMVLSRHKLASQSRLAVYPPKVPQLSSFLSPHSWKWSAVGQRSSFSLWKNKHLVL